MPRTRPPSPSEFRQQIIELYRAGRSVSELAREFEPSSQAIRDWITQADLDTGCRTDGVTTDEREELRRLRRAVTPRRIEREMLAKAAAWFARETEVIPSQSSPS